MTDCIVTADMVQRKYLPYGNRIAQNKNKVRYIDHRTVLFISPNRVYRIQLVWRSDTGKRIIHHFIADQYSEGQVIIHDSFIGVRELSMKTISIDIFHSNWLKLDFYAGNCPDDEKYEIDSYNSWYLALL